MELSGQNRWSHASRTTWCQWRGRHSANRHTKLPTSVQRRWGGHCTWIFRRIGPSKSRRARKRAMRMSSCWEPLIRCARGNVDGRDSHGKMACQSYRRKLCRGHWDVDSWSIKSSRYSIGNGKLYLTEYVVYRLHSLFSLEDQAGVGQFWLAGKTLSASASTRAEGQVNFSQWCHLRVPEPKLTGHWPGRPRFHFVSFY